MQVPEGWATVRVSDYFQLGLTGMLAGVSSAAFNVVVGKVLKAAGYDWVFLTVGLLPLLAFAVLVFGVGRVHMAEELRSERT